MIPASFVRLNALRQEFSVPEQGIGRDRRGYVLRSFFVGDVNDFKRDSVLLCSLTDPRHPIVRKRALIGAVEDKAVLRYSRMSGTFPEFRRCGIRHERQVHMVDSEVGSVCDSEALVGQKLRIGKKFPLPSPGTENADAFLFLRSGIADAFGKEFV